MIDSKRIVALAALTTLALAAAPNAARASTLLLLHSARAVDAAKHTVVLPVHRGTSGGKTVWYVLTDVSDAGAAAREKLIFAPQLAAVGATQHVSTAGSTWTFAAAPDFSKKRVYAPSATGFPPASAAPGAVAPAGYSPFVTVGTSAVVYNAPIVATGDGPFDVTSHTDTSDRVLALDAKAGTVTLLLADGYADGKKVLYISTEASDPGVAAIERATYAPRIGTAPVSARLKIFAIVNGNGQGLADVALHGGLAKDATLANASSLATSRNVLGGLPASLATGGIYDPLWDAYVGAWTPAAVTAKRNGALTSAAAVSDAVAHKSLTAPGGKAFDRAGLDVNCPVIAIEN